MYSKKAYAGDFDYLLKTYVESGIPILIALENSQIGHVANLIGRTTTTTKQLTYTPEKGGVQIASYLDQFEDYIMIDDNRQPYRIAPLNNPAANYAGLSNWSDCQITSFIVPLYPKIYLEADEAALLSKLTVLQLPNLNGRRLILRTLLCSNRSFKNFVAYNNSMDPTVKELIINLSMPKFVWICEISDEADNSEQARGMVLIDATDKRKNGVLASYFENEYIVAANGQNQTINVPLQPFNRFNNLNLY